MDNPKMNLPTGAAPSSLAGQRRLPWLPVSADIEPPTNMDRLIHAAMGRVTQAISPVALTLAYFDWALHLGQSPGKLLRLQEKALRKLARFNLYALRVLADPKTEPCIEPLPQDHRFESEGWQHLPFNLIYQSFLLHQQWWHNLTTGISGVSPHHERVISFIARQLLDTVSPVNFIATNPDALTATVQQGGQNLWWGAVNFFEDYERMIAGKPPVGSEAFQPGETVAATPGKVIYRNRLIELIQYAPTTGTVYAEPVLIVPACIMKYYILDLSPHNSLVKYLVDQGHTVFMISWHNPTANDSDLNMVDYLRQGILDALDAVRTVIPERRINAVGYCLGGTMLAIIAAYLAREKDRRLQSLTLLAAQTDFTEAGELKLFIDDSQLDYLDDIMWGQGYLDTRQMAGAFQLLRSNDLIWSLSVQEYLLGQRQPMIDLMAWNSDATRMPFRMHSEYLRSFFLNNELFEGRYKFKGKPIALNDISVPMFIVATERDHVAPWRSVYKINLVTRTDMTFVLTSGGHNAGVVSEPGHRNRHFRISHWRPDAAYVDPDSWVNTTPEASGSWWPAWASWLARCSSERVAPPPMGAPEKDYPPLAEAPGSYVLER